MYETTLSNGQRQYTIYSKDGRILLVTSQWTLAKYVADRAAKCKSNQYLVVGPATRLF
jgi:hypothetical protein